MGRKMEKERGSVRNKEHEGIKGKERERGWGKRNKEIIE